jgi:hypothetical protein
MGRCTTDSGRQAKNMVSAKLNSRTAATIKETFIQTKFMGKVITAGKTRKNTRVNGSTIRCTVKEN